MIPIRGLLILHPSPTAGYFVRRKTRGEKHQEKVFILSIRFYYISAFSQKIHFPKLAAAAPRQSAAAASRVWTVPMSGRTIIESVAAASAGSR